MSSKHTPGPWWIEKDGSAENNNEVNVVNGSDGTMIVYGQANDADARLIAAAPELLDALQYLAADFRSVVNSEFATHRLHDPAKNDPAYLKAMAAIAKAIG